VHFCIIERVRRSMMQFGTVSVRNCTIRPRRDELMQKCTLPLRSDLAASLPHAREDIVDLSLCRIAASTSFPVVSGESA
jgi:hypothetical protein